MPKAKPEKKSISQRTRFIKAAREAECSEDEVEFDATLKKIGSHKPEAPMAKELKTSAELEALLIEGVVRYSVGREPNPRWIKIVPADPDKEGANWKVSHSSRTVPTGDIADAINRVTPELQKLYDLKEE